MAPEPPEYATPGPASVKACEMQAEIKTIREFEDWLRDAGNYSHAAAKAIASGGWKAYRPTPRDEDGRDDELAALLRRAASHIHP